VLPLLSEAGIVVFHDTMRIDGCREFVLDLHTKFNDGTFDLIDLPWGVHPTSGARDGLSIYVKLAFANHQGIDEICSSPSAPPEIYRREREWYAEQVRNGKQAGEALRGSAGMRSSGADGVGKKIGLARWRAGQYWESIKRRLGK